MENENKTLDTLTSEQDIANKLGQIFFFFKSPTEKFPPKFTNFKRKKKKTKLNFK